jgi:uracil phosphoribosyltransferase
MSILTYPDYPHFYQVTHPLIQHKVSLLRNKKISKREFKELLHEISILLAYEVTKDLPMKTIEVKTPLEICQTPVLAGKKPVILPILRAGIGMVDGFLTLMPSARVGHIGLYRDEETLQPQMYFSKIPNNSQDRQFYICDPMLATGGSAIAAIRYLQEKNVKRMVIVCIVTAPEGVRHVHQHFPQVPIYAASLDRSLNDKGYIQPGLGDAGDRLFGTK